jgi:hypothetical protein
VPEAKSDPRMLRAAHLSSRERICVAYALDGLRDSMIGGPRWGENFVQRSDELEIDPTAME